MSSIETLITEKGIRERWYPQAVERYRVAIKLDSAVPHVWELRQNLSYSLQYIEFLELEFKELNVSSVIYTMLCKSYVITGMSILEGIFSNIIKSNGWWKRSTLESIGETTSNETNFGDKKYVVKTALFKRVEEYDLQMTLDEMINKLVNHHEALGINHLDYPVMKRLRQMRNRVHLQMISGQNDHDYNAFNWETKHEMQTILYHVLTSPKITDYPQYFEFLNPGDTAQRTEQSPGE